MATDVNLPDIQSGGYIAAPSSRLACGPLACRVLDHDIVLFRDSAETAHALLDRCCHRGVRLSLGTASGDQLACGYHGGRYDTQGRCVSPMNWGCNSWASPHWRAPRAVSKTTGY